MISPVLEHVGGRLASEDQQAVERLLAEAERVDGVPPVSEQAVHQLCRGELRSILLRAGGSVMGYAGLAVGDDGVTVELAVAPDARGRGHGRVLLTAAVTAAAGRPVRGWAHGDLPAARRLAAELSFVPIRELRRLHRRMPDEPIEVPVLPAGVTLRAFDPGADDQAWLALNAAAFADHPEQGAWTAADLAARLAAPDFDPAGFLLAERDGALTGFHWTKFHRAPDGVTGEVYVLGVHPSAQGTGLGRVLLLAGLRVLQDQGIRDVMLYVDADNSAAVRMYERFGFWTANVDMLYERRS